MKKKEQNKTNNITSQPAANPLDLRQVRLFQSLPEEEIQLLIDRQAIQVPTGQVIFHEDRSDDLMFVILEGEVEVVKSLGEGLERIVAMRGRGGLLGEMSLFSEDNRHMASVRARTPTRLLPLTREDLTALLERQPQFAYDLIRLLSRRLEESENQTIRELKEKNAALQNAYDELKAAQVGLIEKEKLEKELEIAKQIQESILPESLPERAGYDFGALMVPARAIGGDFYTFLDLPGGHLGIVVADVSDKGVPAALFMALCYSLIRAEAVRTVTAVETLRTVNAQLLQMNSSGMFVTLVFGILDPGNGTFQYARAAHPQPFLLSGNGQTIELSSRSAPPLGLFDDLQVDEGTLQLDPGGLLLLYSDGVNEPMDQAGNEFGIDPLGRILKNQDLIPAQEQCNRLWQAVQAHGEGQPQQDDFTVVIVKRSHLNL